MNTISIIVDFPARFELEVEEQRRWKLSELQNVNEVWFNSEVSCHIVKAIKF